MGSVRSVQGTIDHWRTVHARNLFSRTLSDETCVAWVETLSLGGEFVYTTCESQMLVEFGEKHHQRERQDLCVGWLKFKSRHLFHAGSRRVFRVLVKGRPSMGGRGSSNILGDMASGALTMDISSGGTIMEVHIFCVIEDTERHFHLCVQVSSSTGVEGSVQWPRRCESNVVDDWSSKEGSSCQEL